MENKNIVQEMFNTQDLIDNGSFRSDLNDQQRSSLRKLANESADKLTKLAMTHWSKKNSLVDSCERIEDKSRLHNIFARMTFDLCFKRDLFFGFYRINGFSIGVFGISRPMPYWDDINGK